MATRSTSLQLQRVVAAAQAFRQSGPVAVAIPTVPSPSPSPPTSIRGDGKTMECGMGMGMDLITVPSLETMSQYRDLHDFLAQTRSRFFDEFLLLRWLGRGGFGRVCAAMNRLDMHKYAVSPISFSFYIEHSQPGHHHHHLHHIICRLNGCHLALTAPQRFEL